LAAVLLAIESGARVSALGWLPASSGALDRGSLALAPQIARPWRIGRDLPELDVGRINALCPDAAAGSARAIGDSPGGRTTDYFQHQVVQLAHATCRPDSALDDLIHRTSPSWTSWRTESPTPAARSCSISLRHRRALVYARDLGLTQSTAATTGPTWRRRPRSDFSRGSASTDRYW
jgi:hypothetical protein